MDATQAVDRTVEDEGARRRRVVGHRDREKGEEERNGKVRGVSAR